MPNQEKKFYAVAPLIKSALRLNKSFTYSSLDRLNIGDLVLIDFRNQEVTGVILKEERLPPRLAGRITIKEIKAVKLANFFTPDLLWVLEKAKDHYLTSLTAFLLVAAPKISFKKESKNKEENKEADSAINTPPPSSLAGKIKIKKETLLKTKEILLKLKKQKSLLLIAKERIDLFIWLLAGAVNAGGQALLLVPDTPLLLAWEERLKKVFGESAVAVLGKNRTDRELFADWNAGRLNQKKIILGTPWAIMGNYPSLKLILIDEAQDPLFKQWAKNPRYDARWLANTIALRSSVRLVLGTACPTIDQAFYYANKTLSFPSRQKKKLTGLVDGGDRQQFITSKIIAEPIIDQMSRVLAKNKTVFLGTPQKGWAAGLFCADCGFIPTCPACGKNYYLAQKDQLCCPTCQTKIPAPAVCPQCQAPFTKTLGIGKLTLMAEIKKIYPEQTVLFLDEGSPKEREAKIKSALSQEGGLVLGAPNSLRLGRFNPKAGLLVLLNSDRVAFLWDYNAEERKYQEIAQWPNDSLKFMAQTKYRKEKAFRKAFLGKWESFFNKNLQQRKEGGFPPFTQLIKFTANGQEPCVAEQKLKRLAQKIAKTGLVSAFTISDPYPGLLPKKRDRCFFNLTLTFVKRERADQEKLSAIVAYAQKAEIAWEVDPLETL